MYESLSNTFWDGYTASGLMAPEGTYFYIVNVKAKKKEMKALKGSLTLVR